MHTYIELIEFSKFSIATRFQISILTAAQILNLSNARKAQRYFSKGL